MGQKVNPISLRLEKTNRHFDSCWYDDYNYTTLFLQDLNIKNYFKTVLNQIKYPEGRILIENLPKKTNVNLFYSNPTNSRRKKNKQFQLQNFKQNKQKEYIKDRTKGFVKKKNYFLQKRCEQSSDSSFFPLARSNTHTVQSIKSIESVCGNTKMSSSLLRSFSKLENFVVKPYINNNSETYTKKDRERFIIRYLLAQFYLHFLQNKEYTYTCIVSKSCILFSYFILSSQLEAFKHSSIPFEKDTKDTNLYIQQKNGVMKNNDLSKLQSKNNLISGLYTVNRIYKPQLESVLSKQYNTILNLDIFRSLIDKQSAFFLVQEIIHYLERKIPFRRIKSQLLREIVNYKRIKGIRITCSGRVGGRSKKAQRSKTQSAKIGQTSLGVFSSKIDFACKSAYTRFGLIGVKVWICYQ